MGPFAGLAPFRIILVTDPAFDDDRIERCVLEAGGALPEGALCVQVRDRRRLRASLRLFAGRLRRATLAVGAGLVVNGDAYLARDVAADGVHLGQGGGTVAEARRILGRTWVSVPAHSDGEVRAASEAGADAVLVSPVFSTRPPTLLGVAKTPRGVDAIQRARAVAAPGVAVYALGGIAPENAAACARAGADGVAVLRALLASRDCARTARALHDSFRSRW